MYLEGLNLRHYRVIFASIGSASDVNTVKLIAVRAMGGHGLAMGFVLLCGAWAVLLR